MPENKLQHYVPRVHLRPFCEVGELAINVFNLDRGRAIQNAPLKGQCARNYHYGTDGELEKLLQEPEGDYARIVRLAAADPASVTATDIVNLRTLMLLQYFRSFGYVEKLIAFADKQDADLLSAAGGDVSKVELRKLTIPDAVQEALFQYRYTTRYVRDLDTVIVVNDSRIPFVTSDDPVVDTNRYHLQSRIDGGVGFGSSGLMLSMPLTPRLLLISFDPHVYVAPGRKGHVVPLREDRDATDLNELQYLQARHNIYFPRWGDRERIKAAFNVVAPDRPEQWHTFMYFRQVEGREDGDTFERVDATDMSDESVRMMRFSRVIVKPRHWTRLLKYRLRPRVVDTGTGMGVVRPNHPLLYERERQFG